MIRIILLHTWNYCQGYWWKGEKATNVKKREALLFALLDNTGHKAGSVCACLTFNMSFQEKSIQMLFKNPVMKSHPVCFSSGFGNKFVIYTGKHVPHISTQKFACYQCQVKTCLFSCAN